MNCRHCGKPLVEERNTINEFISSTWCFNCDGRFAEPLPTKKWAVWYELPGRPVTYIHIFHTSGQAAVDYCCLEGVGFDGRQKVTVTKDQIIRVEEVK
jgi:hypothetical protein